MKQMYLVNGYIAKAINPKGAMTNYELLKEKKDHQEESFFGAVKRLKKQGFKTLTKTEFNNVYLCEK